MNLFDLVTRFFDSDFASRWTGQCTGWTQQLAAAHVIADIFIWLAYMTIPIALVRIARLRRDIPFNSFFFLFAVFIVGCGLTHLAGAITTFAPYYYVDFWVKAVTAVASVGTAWMFWMAFPRIVSLPNPFTTLKMVEDMNKELENFALVAAHDLQDPLRQNHVFMEMIKKGKLELIDEVMNNNTRLINFVKNLLDFARSGSICHEQDEKPLKAILGHVIRDLELRIQNVEIKMGPLPSVKCDPVQLGRVFQNLISNAVKGEASVIDIQAKKVNGMHHITVADNGVGIKPEQMKNLFVIYRGKKSDSTGAGFGLAICKRVIESHQGKITARSEVGKGTTFCIELP